jgi:hypothetical protein
MLKGRPVVEMTGRRFGRLVVVRLLERRGKSAYFWECRCDCGIVKGFDGHSLRRGHVQSCGCLKRDLDRMKMVTHGDSRAGRVTPEYRAWRGMKSRCYRTTIKCYPYYGGRGIRVCDRWLTSFENFLADMGRRPSSQHSLERKDPDGHYEPSNCKWATKEEQMKNRYSRCQVCHSTLVCLSCHPQVSAISAN